MISLSPDYRRIVDCWNPAKCRAGAVYRKRANLADLHPLPLGKADVFNSKENG